MAISKKTNWSSGIGPCEIIKIDDELMKEIKSERRRKKKEIQGERCPVCGEWFQFGQIYPDNVKSLFFKELPHICPMCSEGRENVHEYMELVNGNKPSEYLFIIETDDGDIEIEATISPKYI
jgi:hypothetical protein